MSYVSTNQFAEGQCKAFIVAGPEAVVLTLGKMKGDYFATLSNMPGSTMRWYNEDSEVHIAWKPMGNVEFVARIPSYIISPVPANGGE